MLSHSALTLPLRQHQSSSHLTASCQPDEWANYASQVASVQAAQHPHLAAYQVSARASMRKHF